MNTCATCEHWNDDWSCDKVEIAESIDETCNVPAFHVLYSVSDDYNLNIKLCTGPKFGCVHHSLKDTD